MINYDGRRFRPAEAAESDRVAVYRQDGDLLWGEFHGGRARRGVLAGTCAPDGGLDVAESVVVPCQLETETASLTPPTM